MVAACDLFGGVQAVLREQIQYINHVKESRHDPIHNNRAEERAPGVGKP
jgi:hypothetical protein